jgi:hypothetical protein
MQQTGLLTFKEAGQELLSQELTEAEEGEMEEYMRNTWWVKIYARSEMAWTMASDNNIPERINRLAFLHFVVFSQSSANHMLCCGRDMRKDSGHVMSKISNFLDWKRRWVRNRSLDDMKKRWPMVPKLKVALWDSAEELTEDRVAWAKCAMKLDDG